MPRKWQGWILSGLVSACLTMSTALAFDIMQPLPAAPPIPADNPLTAAKIELGKQLFFDPRLSVNGSITCNSCHNVMAGGQDERAVSPGALGKAGKRNAPTLWNVAFQTVLNWDGRALSLEEQISEHLFAATVMALPDAAALSQRLHAIPGYRTQFSALFGGDAPITAGSIAKSLASYIRTLLTPNSAYDRYLRGEEEAMSPGARRGLEMFNEFGCMSCHFGVNLAGPAPGPALGMGQGFYELFPNHVGSDYETTYQLSDDLGVYYLTKNPRDRRMWRVPLLRNIAVTGPYFHNGSVARLDVAVRVMALTQLKIELGDAEVRDIVAFLESLTGEFPPQVMPRLPSAMPTVMQPRGE